MKRIDLPSLQVRAMPSLIDALDRGCSLATNALKLAEVSLRKKCLEQRFGLTFYLGDLMVRFFFLKILRHN